MIYELTTILALFVVQIADVWTTNQILARGGRELNPIIKWIMDKTGDQWSVVKVAAALIVSAFLWADGNISAVWIITAITGLVALNNYRVLRGMR